MLYEKAHCKKEKEHQRNLKHETNGKCKLTRLIDRSRSVQDVGKVKCVENGGAAYAGSQTAAGSQHQPKDSHSGGSRCSPAATTTSSASSNRSNKLSSAHSNNETAKTIKGDSGGGGGGGAGAGGGGGAALASRAKCFDTLPTRKREPCKTDFKWQHAEYCRDECGSGIRPLKMAFGPNRKAWCTTPLSMYQSTIGELARKILCNEFRVQRNVNVAPPCNVCEYALPLCRGYYRKYDCVRGCEEEYARRRDGKKLYRDRVQRYWEPCLTEQQKPEKGVRDYAPHNAYLGAVVRRKFQDSLPCW